MLNPFKEVNWQPDTAARRVFAKSLMIGFPCLATLFLFAGRLKSGAWNPAFPLQLATIGAGAGALFWLAPAIAKPFYVVWYALACCIGLVVGNVVLALVFYVLVTGIGLLKRLGGNQLIRKVPDPQAKSYWREAPPASNPQRYFSQY
jgi:hypothetical protein